MLSRFLTKYDLLDEIDVIKGAPFEPVPNVFKLFRLDDERFTLRGYGTLYNFIKFYNMLVENYDYNRDGEETVKALKRILKKEEKKDNKE